MGLSGWVGGWGVEDGGMEGVEGRGVEAGVEGIEGGEGRARRRRLFRAQIEGTP